MKKSFLFLAEGFEEVEALAVVDVLRRGNVDVQTVSVTNNRQVTGAHGVTVTADVLLADVKDEEAECLICPGGMPGAKNLAETPALIEWLQRQVDGQGLVAAICAAPALVFSRLNIKANCVMTCYPGFESYLPNASVEDCGVATDDNVITGKGPGYAVKFGLAVLEKVTSFATAKEVAAGMLLEWN